MAGEERRGVGIRLFVSGAEVVKRTFDGIADSGRKMFAEIAMGQKSANPAVVALSRTAKEGQEAVGGLAARSGAAGRILGSFGAAGIGAGAAIGGLVLALNSAREAMDWADGLQDQANLLGIGVERLQEYQYALRIAGGEADKAGDAIEAFDKKFGAAVGRYGKRDVKPFLALGFTQQDLDSFASMEEALQATIDKIAALEDASQQAAIADKLGLSDMLPLIREGTGGFQRLAEEARKLGIVIDDYTVDRMARAKDEAETYSTVIDRQLKVAFADLGPVIVSVTKLVAALASAINDVADAWKALDARNTQALRNELDELKQEKVRLRRMAPAAERDAPMPGQSGVYVADDRTMRMGVIFGGPVGSSVVSDPTVNTALAAVDKRIGEIEAVLKSRETPPRTPPAGGGGNLASQLSSGGGGREGRSKAPTPEELAERRAAIDREQRLAMARALGAKATEQAIEDEKFLADRRKAYAQANPDWSPAAVGAAAQFDLDNLRWAKEWGERVKTIQSGGEGFRTTEDELGKIGEAIGEALDEALAWEAERRETWARSVGDATAAGLDAALQGDFFEWFRAQLYRAALGGLSDAITGALSGSAGDGVWGLWDSLFGPGPAAGGAGGRTPGNGQGAGGGFSLGGALMKAGSSILGGLGGLFGFGGNRAAGGPARDGAWYRVSEFNKPELALFGGNGQVIDPGSTQRMLQQLAGVGSGGGASAARVVPQTVEIRPVLQVPAGYTPPEQLQEMMQATWASAIQTAQQMAGPAARADAINFKYLKD